MELPTDQSVRGYDAMSLLALAIKNAGTLKPEAARETLTNITDYQGQPLSLASMKIAIPLEASPFTPSVTGK